jgi:hypothetical protein
MRKYEKRHVRYLSEFQYDDDGWIVFIRETDQTDLGHEERLDDLAFLQTKTLADALLTYLDGKADTGPSLAEAAEAAAAVAAADIVIVMPIGTTVAICADDGSLLGGGTIASARIMIRWPGEEAERPCYVVALDRRFEGGPDEGDEFMVGALVVHEDNLVAAGAFRRPDLDSTGEGYTE